MLLRDDFGKKAHIILEPLLGYHLIAVEGFAGSTDPRSSDVWGFLPLVGPPIANRSWGREQTNRSPKDPYDEKQGWYRDLLAQRQVTKAPSRSQAWGRGNSPSTWWPHLCPWCLHRLSPHLPQFLNALDVVGLSWLTRLCNVVWTLGALPPRPHPR